MWYLIGGLIVLGFLAAISSILSDKQRRHTFNQEKALPDKDVATPEACCGQHAICEREKLLIDVAEGIVYYDDEELDVYRGLPSGEYSEETVDLFREILYTLKNAEVAGWIRSLQLRGICLPDTLKDETLLILGEKQL